MSILKWLLRFFLDYPEDGSSQQLRTARYWSLFYMASYSRILEYATLGILHAQTASPQLPDDTVFRQLCVLKRRDIFINK